MFGNLGASTIAERLSVGETIGGHSSQLRDQSHSAQEERDGQSDRDQNRDRRDDPLRHSTAARWFCIRCGVLREVETRRQLLRTRLSELVDPGVLGRRHAHAVTPTRCVLKSLSLMTNGM
jgi:hypothetical protein